jgi:hypothetical protein
MKPCTGCKHLHISRRNGAAYCQEHWDGFDHVMDQYTGTFHLKSRSKYQQGNAWAMRVGEMRASDGPCGPEAKLFAPSRMWRFMGWVEQQCLLIAAKFRHLSGASKLK